MSHANIRRVTGPLKLLGAVLLAASGLRLVTVGLTRAATGDTSDRPPDSRAPAAGQQGQKQAARIRRRDGGLPPVASAASSQAGSGSPNAKSKSGKKSKTPPSGMMRVELAVSAGPPGSEVYVKGRRKGTSPFVGDVVCKVGEEEITIEVLPPKGMPLTFRRMCTGKPIQVQGD